MTRRSLFAVLLASVTRPAAAQSLPDFFYQNRIMQAMTLLRTAVVDAAAAGLITQQALSLMADWHQRQAVALALDGVTQQIDVLLADRLARLGDIDRAYIQPYADLIVALRRAPR